MVPLTEMSTGESVRVVALEARSSSRLRQIAYLGIVPGALLEVMASRPAFLVRCGGTSLALEENVARDILVERGKFASSDGRHMVE